MSEGKRQIGDMKHGLGGARPQLSIVPRVGMIYGGRAIEYGGDKYARGNFHGPPPAKLGENAEAKRLLGYIDAAMRHLMHVSDAINRALGTGGDVATACALVDDEASGNFPPSMLPHLSHALASLLIGVSCAADGKLIPIDPGQPWKALLASAEPGLPQKDDPSSERRRVSDLIQLRSDLDTSLKGTDAVLWDMAADVLRKLGKSYTAANMSAAIAQCRAALSRARSDSRQAVPVEFCEDPACPALEHPEDLHSHPKPSELEELDRELEKGFVP